MKKFLLIAAIFVCFIIPCSVSANVNDYNSTLVLMLSMNQTPATPLYFNDSSSINNKITNIGSPTSSTELKALGNASVYLSGSSALTVPLTNNVNFSNSPFTISAWIYPTSGTGTYRSIYGTTSADGLTNSAYLRLTNANKIQCGAPNATATISLISSTTPGLNRWTHVACERNATDGYNLYVNGVLESSDTMPGAIIDPPVNPKIGKIGDYSTTFYWIGYIDEFSIWKGSAIPISDLYPQKYEINTAPPISVYTDFSSNTTTAEVGTPIYFNDLSTPQSDKWSWLFGDETYTNPWIIKSTTASWTARQSAAMVTNFDGSLLLTGGVGPLNTNKNDVWLSVNNGTTWTRINENSAWTARDSHCMVTTPNGTIVITGGSSPSGQLNDTWSSFDYGKTWISTNASSGWEKRYGHNMLTMPDGDIVLFAGTRWDPNERYFNDTWKSSDGGSTWVRVNASSGWEARQYPTSVVLSDGTIVMMGGRTASNYVRTAGVSVLNNDTWKSTDEGTTWMKINSSSGWLNRTTMVSVAMPDDSIVIMQGELGGTSLNTANDTWRSTDGGYTWVQTNSSSGWNSRWGSTITRTAYGSIVITGGINTSTSTFYNDSWEFQPSTVFTNNTTHAYAYPGNYTVSLVSQLTPSFNTTLKRSYSYITPLISCFNITPSSGVKPLSVSFNYTGSQNVTTFLWEFGDGATSGVKNTSYVYTTNGTYLVNLTVTDSYGNSNKTSSLITVYTTAPSTLYADFSASPLTPTVSQSVGFTDLSTGSPNTWNWSFGDGINSTLQNPSHAYSSLGYKNITLTVTNATGASNTTTKYFYINVNTTGSGINEQDIEMDPLYTLTIHFTDSTTNTAIPTVTVTTSSGQTNTSINGVVTFFFPYSTVVVYASATGYVSTSHSYVMDSDRDEVIQMVPANTLNNYAVTYPPKDVRFHVQTLAGSNLQSVYAEAVPYLTTLGNYEYVADLFGYNFQKVPLSNQSLFGYTDSRGDITFAMMADVQYAMYFNKSGYSFQNITLTPHDDNYIIIPDTTGSLFVTNGTSPSAAVTYIVRSTRINASYATINVSYSDIAGATTGGTINLYRNANNNSGIVGVNITSTFSGNTSWRNFTIIDRVTSYCPASTSTILNNTGGTAGCYNQTNIEDSSYLATAIGNTPNGQVNEVGTTWFRKTINPIAGLSPEFALFIALFIMMFTSLMAGTSTAPAVSLVVTFEGWVFWGSNMFILIDPVPLYVDPASGSTTVPIVLTIMTFITILWLFVEYRRKGK